LDWEKNGIAVEMLNYVNADSFLIPALMDNLVDIAKSM
jgi:hypothetical protein